MSEKVILDFEVNSKESIESLQELKNTIESMFDEVVPFSEVKKLVSAYRDKFNDCDPVPYEPHIHKIFKGQI